MNRKSDFYRKCHGDLSELNNKNQIPRFFINSEVINRLNKDGAISYNGIWAAITSKGEELFHNKYYIELAEKTEYEEKERELRERDSFLNQKSVEEAIEQNKINRQMLSYQKINIIISGIAAVGVLLGLVCRCN